MQRELERATNKSFRGVPVLPVAIIVGFYLFLYGFTFHKSWQRQSGKPIETRCVVPWTVAGDCKFYDLDNSPALPVKVALLQNLAIDFVLVDKEMRYSYEKANGTVVLHQKNKLYDRRSPLGSYQTVYNSHDFWLSLPETPVSDLDVSEPFPDKFIGKRLRTTDWSLEPLRRKNTDNFWMLLDIVPLFLPMCLAVVLPPTLARIWGHHTFSSKWHIGIGFAFCFLFHGVSGGLMVLLCAAANFVLAKVVWRKPFAIGIAWALNLPLLILCYTYVGPLDNWISFCSDGPDMEMRFEGRCQAIHKLLHSTTSWPGLLGFAGLAPWLSYRFVMLKQIAFFVDYVHAARGSPPGLKLDGKPDLIVRQEKNLPLPLYSFPLYVAYIFYPPLYCAGPIVNFNAFISQVYDPQTTYSASEIAKYWSRFVVVGIGIWVCLHFNYATVILYRDMAPQIVHDVGSWEMFGLMHWMLQYNWLSLLLIWRLARGFALIGGIDTPENMLLCVDANYRFETFWRIWHASLNRWALRNIYFPINGRKRPWLAVPLIFSFVAFWHESTGFWTEPSWYLWGFLNALGVIVEKALGGMKLVRWPHPLLRAAFWGLNIMLIIGSNVPVLFFSKTLDVMYSFAFTQSGEFRLGMLTLFPMIWLSFSCSVLVTDALRPDTGPRALPQQSAVTKADAGNADISMRSIAPVRRSSIRHSSFLGGGQTSDDEEEDAAENMVTELSTSSVSMTAV